MARNILTERDALLAERGLVSRQLPALVERSWERCLQNGIDARDDRLFQSPPRPADAPRIEEEYRRFIGSALPEMELVLGAMSNSQWCVLCTNASGMVVKAVAHSQTLPPALKVVAVQGKGISEHEIGTTAPGCALIEQAPARVDQRQHFLNATHGFVCAAAPIFGARGELAGVLDLSGVGVIGHPGILEMVALSAQAIENRLVLDDGDGVTVRIHYRADVLHSPRAGLLRFSRDGILIGANTVARRLLSLHGDAADASPFERLFDGRFASVVEMWRLRDGRGVLRTIDGEQFSAAVGISDDRPFHNARPRAGVRSTPSRPSGPDDPAIMTDAGLAGALERARRVFAHDVPVLIHGETGTGKEVFARLVHETSGRGRGPFVAVDCSAIPPNLIEADLFGHDEGAFTSARRGGARGKIESADKGTLFLDEIGDMPVDLQTRLLRALQEKSITRVGGIRPIPVDFGLISATHRDVAQMVERHLFRQDLFYRIKGLGVTLPPLRERSDLGNLVAHFLRPKGTDRRQHSVSVEAERLLRAYSWPGNIRELRQVIIVACALTADDGVILPEHLPPEIGCQPKQAQQSDPGAAAVSKDRDMVHEALARNGFNVTAAARSLGIARTTLYRRLRKPK